MDPASERISALLAPLTNYERQRPDAVRWSLDTMRILLARPGATPFRGVAIQIGGSKGKGTAAAYLGALALQAGLRTGTYQSPHVQTILERVQLDSQNISESVLVPVLEEVLAYAKEKGLAASFFEVMTAAAYECFAVAGMDLAIFEVGLGGRLDATTAIPVQASIVTSIELEHTEILGDTLLDIAAEKAPVIRPGLPAWTAVESPALEVLLSHARKVEAELRVLDQDFGVCDPRVEVAGISGRLWDGSNEAAFQIDAAAQIEFKALALAWACFRRLFPVAKTDINPMPRPSLPGRCEILESTGSRPLVLDGAHTEGSLSLLATELERHFGPAPRGLLFATASGKRWREGLSHVVRSTDRVWVTGLVGTVSEDPETICAWLAARGVAARAVPDAAAGLRALESFEGVRVVTGSFYLVGEIRERLGAL